MKALVVILNRCQAAYLGCYGNDWLATPTLDALAADGIVFDQHFTDAASPRGARHSWLTGRHRSGGHAETLPGLLWNHAVASALIGDERSPSFQSLFAQDWEQQHWLRRERLAELEQESLLGGTVQTAVEWLHQHEKRDHWLLWLELSALDLPWDPAEHDADALEGLDEASVEPWFDPPEGCVGEQLPADAEDRLSATYAGVVSGVDQWLGLLMQGLKESGLYDDLLMIVTSDCGLPLGEHGAVGDERPWLHEERVHLPLLIHLPGQAEAGRRVHQLTQAVDLLPTLAEAFGLPIPANVHGRSLLSVARGEPLKLRDHTCAAATGEWSIRTQHWHLIVPQGNSDRPPQLYVKPDDRWEMNNVIAQHAEVAEHLELALRRFRAAVRSDRLAALPELREVGLRTGQ